ncbi:MAG: PAS domain S-box protein [Lentisphaerae bacterium]|nr:PAS domain S-box protein [Lentisphaerota bacterium]
MAGTRKTRDELLSEAVAFRRRVAESLRIETERRRATRELKAGEQRYRALFDGMPGGFAVHELVSDASGAFVDYRIVDVNPAFERMTGLRAEEAVGRLGSEVFPASAAHWLAVGSRVAREGVPERFERHSRRLNRTLDVGVFRFGRNCFAVISTDITQGKQTEEALRRAEQLYRGILEDQTDLICRFTPDGDLLYANESYRRYYGDRAALLGHCFMPVIEEDDRETVRDCFRSVGADNPVVTYEYRVRLPGGQARWLEWTDRAIVGARDLVVEYQSVGRDVTERREAQAEIERYRRELEALVEKRTARLSEAVAQLEREIAERRRVEAEDEKLRARLQAALSKALSGYLAICASCKRIRDDDGNWIPLEMYVGKRTEAEFTHGVCPYCAARLYPSVRRARDKGGRKASAAGGEQERNARSEVP